jgi:hypothetical protein
MAPRLTIRVTRPVALMMGFVLSGTVVGQVDGRGPPAAQRNQDAVSETQPPSDERAPEKNPAEAHSEGKSIPEVTIEAQRQLKNRVQTFVRKITASARFQHESVARWHDPLCFEVAGLPRRDAEFVLSRLTQVALSVGANVRQRDCSRQRANFFVVFTPDPARTLKYLNRHPRLLFDRDANMVQINNFLRQSTPLPARIWHNADLIGRNGTTVNRGVNCAGMSFGDFPVNCEAGGTRLTLEAVEGLSEAVIVFDTNRISGLSIGQLADYTAMAGLVDLDINADLAEAPTILRLFAQPQDAQTKGLTDWDRAFLSATYHTDQKSIDQRALIARDVIRDVSH